MDSHKSNESDEKSNQSQNSNIQKIKSKSMLKEVSNRESGNHKESSTNHTSSHSSTPNKESYSVNREFDNANQISDDYKKPKTSKSPNQNEKIPIRRTKSTINAKRWKLSNDKVQKSEKVSSDKVMSPLVHSHSRLHRKKSNIDGNNSLMENSSNHEVYAAIVENLLQKLDDEKQQHKIWREDMIHSIVIMEKKVKNRINELNELFKNAKEEIVKKLAENGIEYRESKQHHHHHRHHHHKKLSNRVNKTSVGVENNKVE